MNLGFAHLAVARHMAGKDNFWPAAGTDERPLPGKPVAMDQSARGQQH
jgi:hypothetical protein